MKKNNRQAFLNRWKETTDIPVQTVGPFTPYYKEVTKQLKVMPIPVLITVSIIIVGFLIYVFGSSITKVVSLLQRGF
ncbi:MAG: hypothetical protein UT26_C0018G0003 [Microgenomates group bacterium GW2011_GWC1_39_12]|nr:MAG: hypothetical protein UT26_C0018G0003 [Microgenomates group bacterium GW2011_GWC1_39_12]